MKSGACFISILGLPSFKGQTMILCAMSPANSHPSVAYHHTSVLNFSNLPMAWVMHHVGGGTALANPIGHTALYQRERIGAAMSSMASSNCPFPTPIDKCHQCHASACGNCLWEDVNVCNSCATSFVATATDILQEHTCEA